MCEKSIGFFEIILRLLVLSRLPPLHRHTLQLFFPDTFLLQFHHVNSNFLSGSGPILPAPPQAPDPRPFPKPVDLTHSGRCLSSDRQGAMGDLKFCGPIGCRALLSLDLARGFQTVACHALAEWDRIIGVHLTQGICISRERPSPTLVEIMFARVWPGERSPQKGGIGTQRFCLPRGRHSHYSAYIFPLFQPRASFSPWLCSTHPAFLPSPFRSPSHELKLLTVASPAHARIHLVWPRHPYIYPHMIPFHSPAP